MTRLLSTMTFHGVSMRELAVKLGFPKWADFVRGHARGSWSRGSAALEFAMATPMLIILLGGTADFGLAEYYKANLANAVAAGAEYAYITYGATSAVNTTNITAVVTDVMYLPTGASANLLVTYSPTNGPGWFCVTTSGATATLSASSQGTICSDSSPAGYYITITAVYTNTGIMGGFGVMLSQPMTESAVVRLQ
jgi:Flp pilus assembly protein TadG